jgi:hypothetical protein
MNTLMKTAFAAALSSAALVNAGPQSSQFWIRPSTTSVTQQAAPSDKTIPTCANMSVPKKGTLKGAPTTIAGLRGTRESRLVAPFALVRGGWS